MIRKPIRFSGPRAIHGRIPTIASAAATTCSPNCVLALDPATGKLKWYYQFTPHDVHDWDATEPNVLVEHEISRAGSKTPAACRSKRLLLCLRPHQRQLLLAEKFVRTADLGERYRSLTAVPVRVPEQRRELPGHATNWNGTAFSPVTRLYYVMAIEKCVGQALARQLEDRAPARGARDEVSPRARYRDRQDRLGNPAGRTDRREESGGSVGNRRRDSVLWRPERLLRRRR